MMKKYTASLNKLNIYVLISAGVHKSWAAYLMKTKNVHQKKKACFLRSEE